jgi:type IV fimbrial biogenesis protein FimT
MKSLAMFKHIKQIGFTLIELMVGIAIMGIVLAVGLPSFRTWIENGQIRTGAESMFNGLYLARAEAIRRNEPVQFRFDAASRSTGAICQQDFPIVTPPTFTQCNPNPAAPLGASNVQIGTSNAMGILSTALATGISANADSATFDGLGRLINGGAVRVDVMNPKLPVAKMRRLVIQISIGGQARLCDPDPGLSPTDPRRCT